MSSLLSEAHTVRRFPSRVRARVLGYFCGRGLLPPSPPGDDLVEVLLLGRLCLADLILCLLRLEEIKLVEQLLGRPIHRLPPCVQRARAPLPRAQVRSAAPAPDDRVFAVLQPPQARDDRGRRRLLRTDLYRRLALMKSGITVSAALAAGATRDDVRLALRRGYVELRQPGEERRA